MTTASPLADVRERVNQLNWYHTLDLAPGLTTPGMFDTRPTAAKVPMPASLEGMRCLDVGTWDGFWAFEMERRGAAEVVALDVADQDRWDWSPYARVTGADRAGRQVVTDFKAEDSAFALAHEILGSKVERLDFTVYDAAPEALGTFDFVFLGSLLLHLRDPVGALAAMRSVCAGQAVIADTVDAIPSFTRPRTATARLEGMERPWWWIPNRAGLLQIVRSAGFEILQATSVYILPIGPAHPRLSLRRVPRQLLSARGREELIIGAKGIPHVGVLTRPLR